MKDTRLFSYHSAFEIRLSNDLGEVVFLVKRINGCWYVCHPNTRKPLFIVNGFPSFRAAEEFARARYAELETQWELLADQTDPLKSTDHWKESKL